MRYTIIDATYEDGLSTVTLDSKWGCATGHARLSPEDAEAGLESQFEGMRFAEMRAAAKIRHMRAKAFRQRAIGAKQLYDSVLSCLCDERHLRAIERVADREEEAARKMDERIEHEIEESTKEIKRIRNRKE